MLCNKFIKETKGKVIRGTFTNCELSGLLYFNVKNEKRLERSIISSYMAKLNLGYSKENNFCRNYLYLQGIEYKIGEVYAALYSPDKLFYRAKLLVDLDYEKVLVNFIDYGNSDIIPKSDLAPLPKEISSIGPMVMLCFIPHIRLIDDTRFTHIIADVCRTAVSLRIEGICSFAEDLSVWSDDAKHNELISVISFYYRNKPIRQFLIDNEIAVAEKHEYQFINERSTVAPVDKMTDASLHSHVVNEEESTKTVIILHVNSMNELIVHEFDEEVKRRLKYLQTLIGRVVDRHRGEMVATSLCRRSVYLTQFSEDSVWYRCRVTRIDPGQGFLVEFIDFGNQEYKSCQSDLMLLTSEMGEEATSLMKEKPAAQRCQLSPLIADVFPGGAGARKYLRKKFVDTMKKVVVTYLVRESNESGDVTDVHCKEKLWLITKMTYHKKDIVDLIKLQLVVKESPEKTRDRSGSVSSSLRMCHDADDKVADYLVNGCEDVSEALGVEASDRLYLVTCVASLRELWIDMGDGQVREMLDSLLAARQTEVPVSVLVTHYIYGVRLAPGARLLRCQVLVVGDTFVDVRLLDRGNVARVHMNDLFDLSAEIIALPHQVLRFRLHDDLELRHDEASIVEQVRGLIENRSVRIVRQSLDSQVLLDLLVDDRSLVQALMSANVTSLSKGGSRWFLSLCTRRHKCIQVSSLQMKKLSHKRAISI